MYRNTMYNDTLYLFNILAEKSLKYCDNSILESYEQNYLINDLFIN